jgi:hypothetical membrane protein
VRREELIILFFLSLSHLFLLSIGVYYFHTKKHKKSGSDYLFFFFFVLSFSSFLMLESNPIPTTTTVGFTNINTPPTSNTIGSIFTPEQVACVCEVLQKSNDIQRLGKF